MLLNDCFHSLVSKKASPFHHEVCLNDVTIVRLVHLQECSRRQWQHPQQTTPPTTTSLVIHFPLVSNILGLNIGKEG